MSAIERRRESRMRIMGFGIIVLFLLILACGAELRKPDVPETMTLEQRARAAGAMEFVLPR